MVADSHGGIQRFDPRSNIHVQMLGNVSALDTAASSASSTKPDAEVTVPGTPPLAQTAPEGEDTMQESIPTSQPGQNGTGSSPSTEQHDATGPTTIPNSQDSTTVIPNSQTESLAPSQPQQIPPPSRKRMADGIVKDRSTSPAKGHARTMSAMSTTSTGSHIGDMSAELKTRLAYAMVKVNNGWQSRSLQEVESLASRAASPASSSSTINRPLGSSASPKLPPTPPAQINFRTDKMIPPPPRSASPKLAPPAPIQPNARRTSGQSRHTPKLMSSHSASATGVRPSPSPQTSYPSSQPTYSPHQHVREQDAIETLLFMSSPGNSASMKHTFSPSASPAPQHDVMKAIDARLDANRRPLPGDRPVHPNKKAGLGRSPLMAPPHSPMDLDSPQQPHQSRYQSRWTPRARANGASGHMRAALSLPSGLGASVGKAQPTLRDEDIERMLDRAADDSSDDEEIQLPGRASGMTSALGV